MSLMSEPCHPQYSSGYEEEKARRLMMEVHTQGRSLVWSGAREQAEHYVRELHSHQLMSTMEHSN